MKNYDVIVIGGGQSALACGYFLRRTELHYTLLDDQEQSGGAWLHAWDSLTLFSPSQFSSLPGWLMPESAERFPSRSETIEYLGAYEKKYMIPVKRSTKVIAVNKMDKGFNLQTSDGEYHAKVVISATGTWSAPFVPIVEGQKLFQGAQIHSSVYQKPDIFKDKKVLIIGGGNSGAQLLAEISKVAQTEWSTLENPTFLPDDVDGRVLFDTATTMYHAQKEGKPVDPTLYNLSSIVMVPSVVEARKRNVLHSKGRINSIFSTGVQWESGETEKFDAIVWCTGFRYATQHLENLGITDPNGRIETIGTRVDAVSGLWLVGYGNWTGFASATLIGVGRSAKNTVNEIKEYLASKK
ncbi:ArsO family NAD(P)H-dependent flavin-containing monooxygenase [Sphingobacterium sp. PCS056]|uniref:ArsO family NAD(P)H-dependent flavin-containing monooxygenase n=1 Tax=Sphingobacterium TaxID=28453 RepID=UPI00200C3AEE|nr:ArsO family NAD(P)H-dependent flavin-containing monooxygenase [Sphingobacterium sp. PCS056]UPZ34871.1 ArsO family NAD(P)H-dependent flavin-containing monooxygenase [Sphingobacterium sp. PCS056]